MDQCTYESINVFVIEQRNELLLENVNMMFVEFWLKIDVGSSGKWFG